MKIDIIKPDEIEAKSFEIISSIIEENYPDAVIAPEHESIVKRVIHTSADFEYLENLVISPGAVSRAKEAKERGVTRAIVSMEKAAKLGRPLIFAIGNAPTALIVLDQMIKEGKIKPELIIGVPVGFVNVVESKELIMESGAEYIVARGRKGGSNVAAAICNALIYSLVERE